MNLNRTLRHLMLSSALCTWGISNSTAATITVSTAADLGPGSLRAAVASAVAGDSIVFSPLIDGVPIILLTGEISIGVPLTMVGNDSTNTVINGSGLGRIFNVSNAGLVKLVGMKMTMGSAVDGGALLCSGSMVELWDCAVSASTATTRGGAIFATGGSLLITGSAIYGNTASGNAATEGGGGIYNDANGLTINASSSLFGNTANGTSGSGGGLFTASGTVQLISATFSNNSANRAGGAIEIAGGVLFITGTDLVNNDVDGSAGTANPGNGGALHASGSPTISVIYGVVSGNRAAREGGGLWNSTGSMTVDGTMIDANTASGDAADDGGGGIFNNGGSLFVQMGTIISNNTADGVAGSGGGIFNNTGGSISVDGATITDNTATRAGGGIEDNSGAGLGITLTAVTLNNNATGPAPGNGGGLHITGAGDAVITGGTVNGNTASQEGGGLWNNLGTMTITGTNIELNTANAESNAMNDQGGGGVFNKGGVLTIENAVIVGNMALMNTGNGGGVMTDGGTTTITGGEISGNTCARAGGGIENFNGTLQFNTGDVLMNTAGVNGGGLHVSGTGTTNVTGGSFAMNTAQQEGGGLWNASGVMTIDGTTIDGNTANAAINAGNDQGGGGVFNIGGTLIIQNNALIQNNMANMNLGNGGGVMTDGGTVTISNSTIVANTCARAGGGIENFGGVLTVNSATVGGALVADGNTAGINGGGVHVSGTGTTTVNGGTFANNVAGQEGGGLWNNTGTMTIDATTIDSNTANAGNNAMNNQGGGGVFNNGGTLFIQNGATITNNTAPINLGNGGGVMTDAGTVTISGSTIASNTCARAGGGIENFGGVLTVNSATVGGAAVAAGNTAGVNGGGIHVSGTGTTTVNGGTFANNVAGQEGGGLWNNTGTMTIDATTIDSNTANAGSNATNNQGGGGVFNNGGTLIIQNAATITNNTAPINTGNGGGVMTDGGSIMITGSMISSNSCARAGGGIENFNGMATLTDLMFGNNTAGVNGGAMHVSGTGTTSFTTSTASGNTALNEGGGLWASNAGAMTITRSTVSGNTALDGGGLFLQGGGVETGTLDVNYSTVSGNTATNDGGGVSIEGGTATLLASTIASNTATNNGGGMNVMAGMLNSNSSIIADNGAGTGADANGAFTTALFTLVEDGSGTSGISNGVNGNLVGTDPGLTALADNGGGTQTHAITSASSVVYNAGDPALTENDQRNFALVGTRDIGSFEFQGAVIANNMLSLVFDLDAFGSEVTFQVTPAGGGAPVASGGPFADVPGGSMEVATFSVADGCYDLTVSDAGGNGITNGGYVLSTTDGVRLIDNTDNFTSGASSMAAVPFCVAPSTTDLLFTSCDKYFWKNGEYIVCNEDPAVAADYNSGGAAGADSGYDFLFFDPNGTYSYVRQRRHNVSDNFANIGSARTCHAKINNWASADQIPNGVKLNVRVRAVVNGVAGAYGPACRFTRDEALANCAPTKLFDVPGFPQFLSCNVTRNFVNNTANRLYARPVSGATQYRFTFTNAELVTPIVRVVSTYYVNLGWGAGVAPALTAGSTYDVTVEAFKGGAYCQAGESCTVTINAMVAGGQQNSFVDEANVTSVFTLYPNPNQGSELTVSLTSLDSEVKTVSLEIMDMSGKLMVSKQLRTQDGRLNNVVSLNGDLTNGMYLVRVIAGEHIYTDRIVIQP